MHPTRSELRYIHKNSFAPDSPKHFRYIKKSRSPISMMVMMKPVHSAGVRGKPTSQVTTGTRHHLPSHRHSPKWPSLICAPHSAFVRVFSPSHMKQNAGGYSQRLGQQAAAIAEGTAAAKWKPGKPTPRPTGEKLKHPRRFLFSDLELQLWHYACRPLHTLVVTRM